MSQLRLDPLTGRWVVIATERSERPSSFASRRLQVQEDPSMACPFCPGAKETQNAPFTNRRPDDGEVQVQVLSNRYPAFSGEEPMVVSHLGPVFTQAPASGVHEVFVLSPDHDATWADLDRVGAASVMYALRDRMRQHATTPGLRYSQAVINQGREAGASLDHPHGQLMSMPFVPGEMTTELAGFTRFEGNCLLCAVVDAETDQDYRIIYQDEHTVTLAPFWSGMPYEMLMIPRCHGPHLYDAPDESLASAGESLQLVLASLQEAVGDVAYNVLFHSAPYRVKGDYHWHAHILPNLATRGGFELGSGVLVNVTAPEMAAEILRSKIKPRHATGELAIH